MTSRLPIAAILLVSACASPAIEGLEAPIVGGRVDSSDPAVGAVLLQEPTGRIRAVCSGTLISPRVVLTAAHCVSIDDPDLVAARVAPRQVYFGTDLDGSGVIAVGEVVKTTYHPRYDSSPIDDGVDIALLLLKAAPPIAPLAINRAPLEGHEGDSLRLVGFGITAGGLNDDGTKREVTTTLDQVMPRLLWVFDATRNTCNGDSGGPLLARMGGVELVAGVTSFGDENCEHQGAYVRVDAHATSFIDPWIAANDPASAAPPTVTPPPGPGTLGDDHHEIPDGGNPELTGGCAVGGSGPAGGLALLLLVALLRGFGAILGR